MATHLGTRLFKAMNLALEGFTPREIADQIGVSERTVYRWFEDPDVRAELERRRQEIAAEARRILAGAATKAARTLVELLDCNAPRVRLDAAIALIDRLKVLENVDQQMAAIQELVTTLRELRHELTGQAESQADTVDSPGDEES